MNLQLTEGWICVGMCSRSDALTSVTFYWGDHATGFDLDLSRSSRAEEMDLIWLDTLLKWRANREFISNGVLTLGTVALYHARERLSPPPLSSPLGCAHTALNVPGSSALAQLICAWAHLFQVVRRHHTRQTNRTSVLGHGTGRLMRVRPNPNKFDVDKHDVHAV